MVCFSLRVVNILSTIPDKCHCIKRSSIHRVHEMGQCCSIVVTLLMFFCINSSTKSVVATPHFCESKLSISAQTLFRVLWLVILCVPMLSTIVAAAYLQFKRDDVLALPVELARHKICSPFSFCTQTSHVQCSRYRVHAGRSSSNCHYSFNLLDRELHAKLKATLVRVSLWLLGAPLNADFWENS